MDNGVFGTGLTFAQFIIAAIVFVGGLIAIKITFNFDLNKYLEFRDQRRKAKCQNACIHFEFFVEDGKIGARSFFVSPSGTLNHICQRCGLVQLDLDQDTLQRSYDYYIKNVKEYNNQNKKFHKLLKKSGYV